MRKTLFEYFVVNILVEKVWSRVPISSHDLIVKSCCLTNIWGRCFICICSGNSTLEMFEVNSLLLPVVQYIKHLNLNTDETEDECAILFSVDEWECFREFPGSSSFHVTRLSIHFLPLASERLIIYVKEVPNSPLWMLVISLKDCVLRCRSFSQEIRQNLTNHG